MEGGQNLRAEPYFASVFLEPTPNTGGAGWIEVIAGSMFSGKTEELLRRLRRAAYAQQAIQLFKPATDTRHAPSEVVSHDQNALPSTVVTTAQQILLYADDADVVGIDEAQFFDEKIVVVADELANRGKRVIIAGLDLNYLGKPFGPMPQLLAIAEFVTKLHAICPRTGRLAHYSHRIGGGNGQVAVGARELYEPLSREAFLKARKAEEER